MLIYHITKQKYAIYFNGEGAAKFGNRWNSAGTRIIYCAESRALALAELSVYLNVAMASTEFSVLTIDVPDKLKIKSIERRLPENWSNYPHIKSTQVIGDEFVLEDKFALMRVPSAIVQDEFNYLINPQHKNFKEIEIVKAEHFPVDGRLFRS